ncbi:MAG: dihydrofolate reductase [Porticoccaceae bacterium]
MKLCLIVAVSRNGVIGRDNQLPWHLPEDLKFFKSVTMGKPILMGRKTFESIGRPLPGRTNIVISRDAQWHSTGVEVAPSLEAAIQLGRQACRAAGAEEIMVIGGEQIYRLSLPLADRLYLTQVDAEVEGDAYFPVVDFDDWQQVGEAVPESYDTHSYRFLTLDRI